MNENFRQIKIYYKFDSNFCLSRGEAFCSRLDSIFLQKRLFYFKFLKRMSEYVKKRRDHFLDVIDHMEKMFTRRNEIFTAFNYIKLSRGQFSKIRVTSPQTTRKSRRHLPQQNRQVRHLQAAQACLLRP